MSEIEAVDEKLPAGGPTGGFEWLLRLRSTLANRLGANSHAETVVHLAGEFLKAAVYLAGVTIVFGLAGVPLWGNWLTAGDLTVGTVFVSVGLIGVGLFVKVSRTEIWQTLGFLSVGWLLRSTLCVLCVGAYAALVVELVAVGAPETISVGTLETLLASIYSFPPAIAVFVGVVIYLYDKINVAGLIMAAVGTIFLSFVLGIVGMGIGIDPSIVVLVGAGVIFLSAAALVADYRFVDKSALAGGAVGTVVIAAAVSTPATAFLFTVALATVVSGFAPGDPEAADNTAAPLRDLATGRDVTVPGYRKSPAESAHSARPTDYSRVSFALRYPLRTDWLRTRLPLLALSGIVIYALVTLTGGMGATNLPFGVGVALLLFPTLVLGGYVLRVLAAAANGYASPPALAGAAGLSKDGLKLLMASVVSLMGPLAAYVAYVELTQGTFSVQALADFPVAVVAVVAYFVPTVVVGYTQAGRVRRMAPRALLGAFSGRYVVGVLLSSVFLGGIALIMLAAVVSHPAVVVFGIPALPYLLVALGAYWGWVGYDLRDARTAPIERSDEREDENKAPQTAAPDADRDGEQQTVDAGQRTAQEPESVPESKPEPEPEPEPAQTVLRSISSGARTVPPGYREPAAELAGQAPPEETNLLIYPATFALRGGLWSILGTAGLALGSVLLLPFFVLWGYLFRVASAASGGYERPPEIGNVSGLFKTGVRFWIGVLPVGFALAVTSLATIIAFETFGTPGAVVGVFPAVVIYLIPTMMLGYARSGRIRALYRSGLVRELPRSPWYLLGWVLQILVAAVCFILPLFLILAVIGIVLWPLGLGFGAITSAALWGRIAAEVDT